MIRNAVGMLITRIAVAATTKRTSATLSWRNWRIVGPKRTRKTVRPTVKRMRTGRIVKTSLPASVRRLQLRATAVIYPRRP
jgi:hypothetical protein